MSRKITTTLTSKLALSLVDPLATGGSDNPLTITGTGAILPAAGDGIDGDAGTIWAITNNGTINAPAGYAVNLAGAGTLVNSGLVAGLFGVQILGAGSVTNKAGGTISSVSRAVFLGSGTVTNAGVVSSGGWAAVGFLGSGTVVNRAGATIAGIGYGVFVGGSGAVTNSGSISGTGHQGIGIQGGATVSNRAGGVIVGYTDGLQIGTGTVTNGGLISGQNGYGVIIAGAGVVTNSDSSTISGAAGGVFVLGASRVTNGDGGSITGGTPVGALSFRSNNGVKIGSGVVSNEGTIAGPGFAGVYIAGAGTVTNRCGGTISGGSDGVFIAGAATVRNEQGGVITSGPLLDPVDDVVPGFHIQGSAVRISSGTVTNAGAIATPTGDNGFGVFITGSATVTNSESGTIQGGGGVLNVGVFQSPFDYTGTVTVTNAGTISESGFDSFGISILSGNVTNRGLISGQYGVAVQSGTVTNAGTISGATNGVAVLTGTLSNKGTISGSNYSVFIKAGSVTNGTGASIVAGGQAGITAGYGGAAVTVTNAGTISGSGGAVFGGLLHFGSFSVVFQGANSRLIIDPGAVFYGAADATTAANSTVELAKGSDAISGIGTGAFDGFATLVVDKGANWTVNGLNTIATVTNNGSLTVAGTLQVTTSVDPASTGLFQLAAAGVLEVAAATGVNAKMKFLGGGELIVDTVASFGQNIGSVSYAGPLLEAFGTGASVDLKDFAYGTGVFGVSYNAAKGILALTNSASQTADLAFQKSSLGAGTFHLANDTGTGVLLTRS